MAIIESLCAPLFQRGAESAAEEAVMLDNESLRIIEETLPLEYRQTVVVDPEVSEDDSNTESESSNDDDPTGRGSYTEMAGFYEAPGQSSLKAAVSRDFPKNVER